MRLKPRKTKVFICILIGLLVLYCIHSIYVKETILRESPTFGAVYVGDSEETECGDPIVFKYNGYYYACLNTFTRYSFALDIKEINEPITRLMGGGFWWSTKHENHVWGYEGDDGRLLVECDYYQSFSPIECGTYYRTDVEFPLVTDETVASIDFYKEIDENNQEILVESNNNKKTIEYWTKRYTDLFSESNSDHKFLVCDCSDHELDKDFYKYYYDTEEDVYYVYATFKNSPFVCRLGKIYAKDMVIFD